VAHLLTGVPFSVTAHAKDIYRADVDRAVFAEVASAAAALITVCDANRRFLEHELLLEPAAVRVERIYNGLPPEVFDMQGGSRDRDLVLAVGRLVEKKGFDVLLRACRTLRDQGRRISCVIIGDGEDRDALMALHAELALGDSVRFIGARPRDEVLRWMARAHLVAAHCLQAADGNRDALPTVIIEALALGVPVVTTAVGGIAEIVDDGMEGWIVPSGDPQALADTVARVLDDDTSWRAAALLGPLKARERFDGRKTVLELINVFEKGRARNPGPACVVS
jgi:glycosyltransferase involved in cell wall biosynthesis